MSKVFISYRRKDAGGYAGRLRSALIRHYGRSSVFMDIDSIDGGTDFMECIEEALDRTGVVLVLIGWDWMGTTAAVDGEQAKRRIDDEKDPVRLEVAAALKRSTVRVIPVMIENTQLPAADDLPEDLAKLPKLHARELRNGDWKVDVERIVRAIDVAAPDPLPARLARGARGLARRPRAVAASLVVLAALVAGVALAADPDPAPTGSTVATTVVESDGSNCINRDIPSDVRAGLAEAADSAKQAVEGSVYYGSCGTRSFAMATFPDGREEVFAQSGFKWVDLGPAVTEKCSEVPDSLLQQWSADDC